MTPLIQLIEELPPELQQEVEDFARFLLETRVHRDRQQSRQAPTFEWAGALEDLRDKYTSVELQHSIAASRIEES